MRFPLKLKSDPAAGGWQVVAGLITDLSVGSLVRMNNVVHQEAEKLLKFLDFIT